MITGFDVGIEKKSKGSPKMNAWYSPIVIARFKVTDKAALAARVEYYSDKRGVIISTGTPNGFQTFGGSVNFDYAIQQNALWRIEARTLASRDTLFATRADPISNITFLTSSISVSF